MSRCSVAFAAERRRFGAERCGVTRSGALCGHDVDAAYPSEHAARRAPRRARRLGSRQEKSSIRSVHVTRWRSPGIDGHEVRRFAAKPSASRFASLSCLLVPRRSFRAVPSAPFPPRRSSRAVRSAPVFLFRPLRFSAHPALATCRRRLRRHATSRVTINPKFAQLSAERGMARRDATPRLENYSGFDEQVEVCEARAGLVDVAHQLQAVGAEWRVVDHDEDVFEVLRQDWREYRDRAE
jgi:hypothetical protein